MLKRLESFFLSSFDDADFITKKKAGIYFRYSLLMVALLLALMLFYYFGTTDPVRALKGSVASLVLAVLVAASVLSLRKGRLDLSVNVYALPTLVIVLVVRHLNAIQDPALAFSSYIFYEFYLIVFLAAFSRKVMVPIASAVYVAANILLFALIKGKVPAAEADLVSTGLINSTVGLIITAVVSYSLVGLTDFYTAKLREDAAAAKAKLDTLESILAVSKEGIDLGAQLRRISGSLGTGIRHIEENIGEIDANANGLSQEVAGNEDSNRQIAASVSSLKDDSSQYIRVVNDCSESITGMVSSVNAIASLSRDKGRDIAALEETIKTGQRKLDDSAKTISKISSGGKKIYEIVQVITDIAERTNLLAMNAAIEAVHAGNAGKGFSVIAAEIRGLSEQTNRNIKEILASLKSFLGDLGDSELINGQLREYFVRINTEMGNVKDGISEILGKLGVISDTTEAITSNMGKMAASSGSVKTAIADVEKMIGRNSDAVGSVREKSGVILKNIEMISRNFLQLNSDSDSLRISGESNASFVNELESELAKIHSS